MCVCVCVCGVSTYACVCVLTNVGLQWELYHGLSGCVSTLSTLFVAMWLPCRS